MNEQDQFEAELKRLVPARPPEALLARLRAAKPSALNARSPLRAEAAPVASSGLRTVLRGVFRVWRPLAAASAALALAVGFWAWHRAPGRVAPTSTRLATAVPLEVDGVQIDQKLLSTFDAIGRLPSGEAVRFRCRKWMDRVTLRDQDRGLVVEQRAPRIEVVPVRFETY